MSDKNTAATPPKDPSNSKARGWKAFLQNAQAILEPTADALSEFAMRPIADAILDSRPSNEGPPRSLRDPFSIHPQNTNIQHLGAPQRYDLPADNAGVTEAFFYPASRALPQQIRLQGGANGQPDSVAVEIDRLDTSFGSTMRKGMRLAGGTLAIVFPGAESALLTPIKYQKNTSLLTLRQPMLDAASQAILDLEGKPRYWVRELIIADASSIVINGTEYLSPAAVATPIAHGPSERAAYVGVNHVDASATHTGPTHFHVADLHTVFDGSPRAESVTVEGALPQIAYSGGGGDRMTVVVNNTEKAFNNSLMLTAEGEATNDPNLAQKRMIAVGTGGGGTVNLQLDPHILTTVEEIKTSAPTKLWYVTVVDDGTPKSTAGNRTDPAEIIMVSANKLEINGEPYESGVPHTPRTSSTPIAPTRSSGQGIS